MSVTTLLRKLSLTVLRNSSKPRSCINLFSSKPPRQGIVKEVDPETGTMQTKKTTIIPKITLISGDSVSITTMQEAEKLAKRRDLKLVKIIDVDTKTQRPLYQLMTGTEYFQEDLKQREQRKQDKQQKQIKGEKVLLLNSKIAQHDLDIQLKKVAKWIEKMYEVSVVISGSSGDLSHSEKVFASVEKFFKEEAPIAQIVQKRVKRADIKFQVAPPKPKPSSNDL